MPATLNGNEHKSLEETTTVNGIHTNGKHPAPSNPLRIFTLSHPRTASNLFCKLFSEHPKVDFIEYPFLFPYFNGPDSQAVMGFEPSEEVKKMVIMIKERMKHATYQYVLDTLEKDIANSESTGKFAMVKEHCCYMMRSELVNSLIDTPRGLPPKPQMEDKLLDVQEERRAELKDYPFYTSGKGPENPSFLPDRLFEQFAPVFIIRHPAKQVGSFYKASRVLHLTIDSPEFEIGTSFKFSRAFFDYFVKVNKNKSNGAGQHWPIVIDGDDLINDTKGIAERFCSIAGLDPSGVIYEWEKGVSTNPMKVVFKGTLNASRGVVKNESPERPDLLKESAKWEKEFGPVITKRLLQLAEKAMPDYDYLYQFRILSPPS